MHKKSASALLEMENVMMEKYSVEGIQMWVVKNIEKWQACVYGLVAWDEKEEWKMLGFLVLYDDICDKGDKASYILAVSRQMCCFLCL